MYTKIFFEKLQQNLKQSSAAEYSPLALAYIGDGVFEMCVRTWVVSLGNTQANKLHNMSKQYVKAEAQSKMYFKILGFLTEEESAIIKRGRNAKSFTTAKNASVSSYRHATGLEALFGYLYIKGKNDRINELFKLCIRE